MTGRTAGWLADAGSRLNARLARVPLWPALGAVSVVTLLVQLPGPHATAWHFFDDAARLLLGDGPAGQADRLHLYRDRPDLQFGPLAIVTAVPLTPFGATGGSWAAMILASVAGLATYALLLDTAAAVRPALRRQTPKPVLLAAGTVAVITWGDVAVRTAHIDDAIAWLAVVAGLRWAVRDRPGAATLALAVAAAAKPWAVMFAPLALLPLRSAAAGPDGDGEPSTPCTARVTARAVRWLGTNRTGVLRLGLVGVLAGLTWLPFILAEPHTLDTAEFGIRNDPTSVLRALGVNDAQTPGWARPAQLGGGMALVAGLVLARRWPTAVMAGVAWRLLLEPGANRYYTVGMVLGMLLVELLARRDRFPRYTVAAAILFEVTAMPVFPGVPGRYLRLACVVAVLVAALRIDVKPQMQRQR